MVFPYLDDVHPGDGGLLVLPGSHKSQFDRPPQLFSQGRIEGEVPLGVINITPLAGDVVIIPECLTHGVLPWKPVDRQRRVLTLRYRPHHRQPGRPIPEEVKERLAPGNTRIARNGALHPQKGNRHSTTGVPQPVIT